MKYKNHAIFVTLYLILLLTGCSNNSEIDENIEIIKSENSPLSSDLILYNAKVYSLNWQEPSLLGKPAQDAPHDSNGWHPDAQAIVLLKNKIIYVGSNQEALKYKTNLTEAIDLKSAVVIPGLIDSHAHIAELGEILHRVNLIDVATPQDAIDRILDFTKNIEKGQWIIGQGWDEGAWANNYPTRQMLDQYFPDNPVYLKSLHGFGGWGNTMAFELAGIDKSTDVPIGGEILKDQGGELLGIVLNNATKLMNKSIPETSDQQFQKYVFDGLQQMSKDGFVAIHQAGASTKHLQSFENLRKENNLPIRVYAMISARDESLSRAWISKGPYIDPEGWLDIKSVKAYYDGALGSRGARLLEDYSDKPGHKGISGDGYGFNGEIVADLMAAGFQVGVHAIGDAGNRETLDYFKAVFDKHPTLMNNRHRIEHAQIIHPEDIPRFAEMSIIASMEPPHAVEDKTWAQDRLGDERIKYAYAWRTLRKAGVSLTFNSDSPGSDHTIFYALHAAITRRDKNLQPTDGWYSEQNMSAEEAIRAYTNWAAYAQF
ncbi:MAG: amidohydrolase, partial [Alcanivoracaceae bacterium]|nr:amidohydrolase [Alcanivoracaceae bacterium]